MPRPRWERLPAQRRAEIANAVVDEVSDVGFGRASINRVLRKVGLSKGSLYYYFDDRGDVMRTAVEVVLGRFRPGLLKPIFDSRTPEDFWTACEQRYRSGVEWLDANPRLRRALAWGIAEADSPRPPAEARTAAIAVTLEVDRLLEHGRGVGAVRDDLPLRLQRDLLVAALWVLDRESIREGGEPEALAKRAVDVCRGLVGARACARPADLD